MGRDTNAASVPQEDQVPEARALADEDADSARHGAGPAGTPIDDRDVPVLRAGMAFTVVDDHLVLHDVATHDTHVLNATSARIWAEIDGHRTAAEISASLADATGTDPAVVARDVLQVIELFAASAILAPAVSAALDTDDGPADPVNTPTAVVATPRDPVAGTGATPDRTPEPSWCGSTGPRRALGASFEVRTDDPDAAVALADAFASFLTTESADRTIAVVRAPSGGIRVLLDHAMVGEALTAHHAIAVVLSEINRLAATGTADRLLLHAGAVERDGRAVVISGPSGHGKSTLTAALVLAGFAYLTDEVVAIDPATGWIDPFPKPFSLHATACRLLGLPADRDGPGPDAATWAKHPVVPSELGTTSDGGRVGLLVLLEDPSPTAAPRATDVPLGLSDFLALLEQTFPDTMAVPDALERLSDLFEQTPVLRLPRQPLDDSVRAITDALA